MITERKLAQPKYYAVDDVMKVLCTTQRAGSTSMIEALRPAHADSQARQIDKREAYKLRMLGWPALLWVRNPYDRFASAYAIFGRGRIPVSREIAPQKGRTANKFAESVLQYTDAHWSPVVTLHEYNGVFIPTRIYPFDSINETWLDEFPGYHMQHLNPTSRMQWKDVQKEIKAELLLKLIDLYVADDQLWQWALANEYIENIT